jgi:transposase
VKKVDVTLRQEHRAGEKLFIDYAGQTVPIIDPATGECVQAQIFIAALGASSYTFAEASLAHKEIRDVLHIFIFMENDKTFPL